jgi:aryl-alcohol dehydrogenase-like predicted oxidoreductase
MDSRFYRVAQGLRLSSLGIGTYLGEMDEETDASYEAALREAIDGGINVIDTSRNYRQERSEQCIGRAIRGRNRDELVICTKAGYRLDQPGHSLEPSFLLSNLDASLRNLGVDAVDVFYLHNPETQLGQYSADAFYDLIRAAFEQCERMAESGQIRFYGAATWGGFRTKDNPLSMYRMARIAKEIGGVRHRFRFVQLPFNLAMLEAFNLKNQDGNTPLQAAGELGITVVGSATVLQGRLTRGLPTDLAAKFEGLKTDAQRSIQFSRSTPGLAVSLTGMSNPAHVQENLGVKNVEPMSEHDYYALYDR